MAYKAPTQEEEIALFGLDNFQNWYVASKIEFFNSTEQKMIADSNDFIEIKGPAGNWQALLRIDTINNISYCLFYRSPVNATNISTIEKITSNQSGKRSSLERSSAERGGALKVVSFNSKSQLKEGNNEKLAPKAADLLRLPDQKCQQLLLTPSSNIVTGVRTLKIKVADYYLSLQIEVRDRKRIQNYKIENFTFPLYNLVKAPTFNQTQMYKSYMSEHLIPGVKVLPLVTNSY